MTQNFKVPFNHFSSNINEVISAVLNPLLFFYVKILHAPKASEAQKRNRAKAQNVTNEQK